MKKRIVNTLLLATVFFAACTKDHDATITPAEVSNAADVYPSAPAKWFGGSTPKYIPAGWVGDVMPYYENDSFHVFYLHDARDGAAGFHPWSKFTTNNLTDYTYDGVMIPYGKSSDYDLAVGTGSIIKYNNTYYAYYCGFNYNFNGTGGKYRDNTLLATSPDLTNWTKQTSFLMKPETTNGYNQWEYRDPYVFYNDEKKEYWMLVTGRQYDKAAVMLYTTIDPSANSWQLKDPVYTTPDYYVPECPQMLKWGKYWYLVFSENSKENTTRYRIATSSSGPWTTPANDKLDGQYMYASKIASDGSNTYLFGWCATKSGSSDFGSRDFGGNLIVHKLMQNSDGTLSVTIPDNISSIYKQNETLTLSLKQQDVGFADNTASFPASDNENSLVFNRIAGGHKMTATISSISAGAEFGLLFGMDKALGNTNYYKVNFNEADDMVSGLSVSNGASTVNGKVSISLEPGKEYQLTAIIDGSVCVVYIDGKVALTSRIYSLNNNLWGMFSKGTVTFKDVKLYGS